MAIEETYFGKYSYVVAFESQRMYRGKWKNGKELGHIHRLANERGLDVRVRGSGSEQIEICISNPIHFVFK